MQYQSLVAKYHCSFCISLVLLIMGGVGACASSNWRILVQDNVSDGLDIVSINFTDANHGWALTATQLLETNDGGRTWTARLENEDAQRTFHSFEFVSPTTGFIVGAQRKDKSRAILILRTTDGGRIWQESVFSVSSPSGEGPLRLHSISFCNPQNGWAAGSDLIIHTVDGGQTWELQRSANEDEVMFSIACVSPETAWVVGQDGLVLQTKDGGKSWSRHDSSTTNNLARVRFFDDSGWIVGGLVGKATLLRMRNSATKWEPVPLNTSEALLDIYINGRGGWIVGANGTILRTDDGGQTWQQEKSPTSISLTSIFFLNPGQGWIGGDKRTILRLVE